jgi:hypothetical protein
MPIFEDPYLASDPAIRCFSTAKVVTKKGCLISDWRMPRLYQRYKNGRIPVVFHGTGNLLEVPALKLNANMVFIRTLQALTSLGLAIAAPQASVLPSAASSPSPSASSSATLTTEETEDLFSLHEELVNMPSISGDEVECAEFISGYLSKLGYYVEEVPVGDTGTFNVFAYPQELKDEGAWPEVLITSHIDTVSIRNPRRVVPVIADKILGATILPFRA